MYCIVDLETSYAIIRCIPPRRPQVETISQLRFQESFLDDVDLGSNDLPYQ